MNYGKVDLPHSSKYYLPQKTTRHSPYLKEKLIYIGQSFCYENGSEAANILLELETNDTEIYRLTDGMGEQLNDQVDQGEYHDIESVENLNTDELIYCQVDGSMLLTREEKWKETKLGRVFKDSSILPQSADRQWIRKSEYIAHLGEHKGFEQKMSQLLDQYSDLNERLVFVNDGAIWIHNWIKAEYPKSTQILDFYHAMTHIIQYAKLIIKDKAKLKKWQEQTSEGLKDGGYSYITERIEQLCAKTKTQRDEKAKLLGYLKRNESRMNYNQYLKRGLLIGSGAIESAHRTVLQTRLKKAGQRWSKVGLKRLINIRVLNKSGHWNMIRDKLKIAA